MVGEPDKIDASGASQKKKIQKALHTVGWRKTPDFPKEHVPIKEKQKQTNLGGFSNQPTS